MFSAGFYRVLVQKSLDVLVSDVFLRKRKECSDEANCLWTRVSDLGSSPRT